MGKISTLDEIPDAVAEAAPPCFSQNGLTARESTVLALGAQGLSDKEIADRLMIALPTLRTFWTRIRTKLGASNRTHAIVLAARDAKAPDKSAEDPRTRIAESFYRDRLASWVWQGRRSQALLDEVALRLFCLPTGESAMPVERLLAHVWAPDRVRFERYLSQAGDLRPMTPIELRVGVPGEYRNLIRTVNLACQTGADSAVVLLASTSLHVFAP